MEECCIQVDGLAKSFAGRRLSGGEVVFSGTPREMVEHGQTITAQYLRKSL